MESCAFISGQNPLRTKLAVLERVGRIQNAESAGERAGEVAEKTFRRLHIKTVLQVRTKAGPCPCQGECRQKDDDSDSLLHLGRYKLTRRTIIRPPRIGLTMTAVSTGRLLLPVRFHSQGTPPVTMSSMFQDHKTPRTSRE